MRACCKAFAEDRDVHQATAAEVLGIPLAEVSADQRRSAKAINFGLIYGMSAFGLARQLGIGRGEAQRYVDLYFERYPGVKRYMDETRSQAREAGYVETVFGRRLYLPDIRSRNQALRQYAERSAINAPMQGTAADIIKRAMIDGRRLAAELATRRRGSSCRCTTSSCSRWRTRRSTTIVQRAARTYGAGRGTCRPAQGRCRHRPQLG